MGRSVVSDEGARNAPGRRTGAPRLLRGRRLRAVVVVLAAPVLLLAASFAVPVRVWRTGELPAPELPVVAGGPAVELADRVWVDTDAACGDGAATDVDDCLALALLARSPERRIVGVSTVHGNAPLAVTDRTVRELMAAVAWPGGVAPAVVRGAAAALEQGADALAAPATAALRRALAEGSLTLLALGPLTNVAAALDGRPDLQRNVRRLVAVMGRRPGHLFHPAEGKGHGMLFGHGPVFTDLNLRQDPEAAARVLRMELPWTLVPYEAGRQVTLGAAELRRLSAAGGVAEWTAARADGWLRFWRDEVGLDGFYPFDLLAAAYAIEPGLFDCAAAAAWVARDKLLFGRLYSPISLLVGLEPERPGAVRAEGEVVYCPGVDPQLAAWSMERLTYPAGGPCPGAVTGARADWAYNRPMPSESELIHDWNRRDGDPRPPRGLVELNDETLRDGLQSPSVRTPSIEDRLRMLHYMAELGVESANIGLPGAGPQVVADVTRLAREIVEQDLPVAPNCAARTLEADIRPVLDIAEAVGKPIEVACFIGSSPIRQYAEGWAVERLLALTEQAVRFAVERGMPVMYVTEDTTRAAPEDLRRLYTAAVEAGARRVCIADTVGHATPAGTASLVHFIREVVDATGEEVRVDWHGHRDRGLAEANALAAALAGADRLHGTILGIGERVGNTALDLLMVNMELLGWRHQDLTTLPDYCHLVAETTGVPLPDNYPVVGRDAFRTATGVHAAAIVKARAKGDAWLADRIYSGVPASLVGRGQVVEIGPMSGRSNVVCWLEQRGLDAVETLVDAIFERAKVSDRTLEEGEILEICRSRGVASPA